MSIRAILDNLKPKRIDVDFEKTLKVIGYSEPYSKGHNLAIDEIEARLDQAEKALTAYVEEECRLARIDEWDFVETLREASDTAMQESMSSRLTQLKEQQ